MPIIKGTLRVVVQSINPENPGVDTTVDPDKELVFVPNMYNELAGTSMIHEIRIKNKSTGIETTLPTGTKLTWQWVGIQLGILVEEVGLGKIKITSPANHPPADIKLEVIAL